MELRTSRQGRILFPLPGKTPPSYTSVGEHGTMPKHAREKQDAKRAYFQMGRYLGALADEVQRARSIGARRYAAKARAAYVNADPATPGEDSFRSLDSALSYAHSALNALLLYSRVSAHAPRDFESFYDVVGVLFQDLI